jgi:hypothetical protein
MARDPGLVSPEVLRYTNLPGGHQEGWADAFMTLIREAYGWIAAGAAAEAKPAMLPTFNDGYRSNCLVEAMLASSAKGGVWEPVNFVPENR